MVISVAISLAVFCRNSSSSTSCSRLPRLHRADTCVKRAACSSLKPSFSFVRSGSNRAISCLGMNPLRMQRNMAMSTASTDDSTMTSCTRADSDIAHAATALPTMHPPK